MDRVMPWLGQHPLVVLMIVLVVVFGVAGSWMSATFRAWPSFGSWLGRTVFSLLSVMCLGLAVWFGVGDLPWGDLAKGLASAAGPVVCGIMGLVMLDDVLSPPSSKE